MRTARKKAKSRANETLSDAILRLATAGQGLDAIVRRLVQQGLRPNADRLPIARQLRTTRFAEVRRKRDVVCSLILSTTCIRSASLVCTASKNNNVGLDSLTLWLRRSWVVWRAPAVSGGLSSRVAGRSGC